jgi:O-antigen ligase
LFFFFHYFNNRQGILDFSRADAASRGMINFAVWCSITFLLTCVWMVAISKIFQIFQAGLYLLHLWGFIICTIFLRKEFLLDRAYFEKTIFTFLVIGLIECVIIIGQNVGAVPYLWSQVYFEAYGGGSTFTGTFGPNRVVPGTAMFLTFAVALSVISAKQSIKKSWIAAVVLAVLSLVVALLVGSRTGYITIASFLVALTLLSPMSVLKFAIPGALILFLLVASGATGPVADRISFMINYRVIEDLQESEKYTSSLDYYQVLGSGRKGKLYKANEFIVENPWIIPVGSGFNNHYSGATKGGNSAHNLYLSLIIENGIVGLVLYLGMLFGFMRGRFWDRKTFTLLAVICGVLVNMFFGENFYIYRPSFGLIGMLFLALSILDIKRDEVAFLDGKKQ